MPAASLLVVGAGVAGLAIAAETASYGPVLVIDRLPAIGGVLGYEDATVQRLHREASVAGANFLLATTALRWKNDQLLVAGPAGINWLMGRWLAFCGGTRPSTPAELGVGGSRPAGVYSATVAVHLLEAGVRLGSVVVLVGGNDWAARAAARLAKQGARVIRVFEEGAYHGSDEDRRFGWKLLEIHGNPRVTEVIIGRHVAAHSDIARIPCDAVVLASGLRPMRNVEGAVFQGRHVTYVQPVADTSPTSVVEEFAREAARQIVNALGGVS